MRMVPQVLRACGVAFRLTNWEKLICWLNWRNCASDQRRLGQNRLQSDLVAAIATCGRIGVAGCVGACPASGDLQDVSPDDLAVRAVKDIGVGFGQGELSWVCGAIAS